MNTTSLSQQLQLENLLGITAAHYIEMVKKRAYGEGFSEEERDAAIYTLHKVLSTVLKLLALLHLSQNISGRHYTLRLVFTQKNQMQI